jgi:hypothetical protein
VGGVEDLSIQSLTEYAGNYGSIRVTGVVGNPIETPFQIRPRQFLSFAELDLQEKDDHHLVNALSNTKRAIECQLDSLLVALGLFSRSKEERWSFPKKTETLNYLGVVAPDILRRINEKRNLLEHEYRAPTVTEANDALDVARLFIEYTDGLLCRDWIDCCVERLDDLELEGVVDITLDYKRGRMVLERGRAKKVIDVDSGQEYLDYLRWFVPAMKKG